MGAPTKPTSEIFPAGQARGPFLTHHHTCRLNLVYGPERGKRHVKMKSERQRRGLGGALQKQKQKNSPIEVEVEFNVRGVFQLESRCCCFCSCHLAGLSLVTMIHLI